MTSTESYQLWLKKSYFFAFHPSSFRSWKFFTTLVTDTTNFQREGICKFESNCQFVRKNAEECFFSSCQKVEFLFSNRNPESMATRKCFLTSNFEPKNSQHRINWICKILLRKLSFFIKLRIHKSVYLVSLICNQATFCVFLLSLSSTNHSWELNESFSIMERLRKWQCGKTSIFVRILFFCCKRASSLF